MRSATDRSPTEEPSGRTAIVDAAVDLIGRHGASGTTVRGVADAADVSAALVIHHFGSKAGLQQACDERVRGVIARFAESVTDDPSAMGAQALLAEPDVGPALAYIATSLQSGGDVGRWWFRQMMQMADDMFPPMVAAGRARAVADVEMTSLLLMAMDLGLLFMRPLVEERLGADLTDPAVLERWALAEVDLLTNGFIVEPGKDDR